MADFDLLKTFITVYRTGSFTKAARQMHLSQPAISMQIRSLETQINSTLFRRLPRGAEPTQAGRELAQAVSKHIDALEATMGKRQPGSGRAVSETVRLGGPEEFMTVLILPLLKPLIDAGLRLRMYFNVDQPIIDRLQSGELDIAVTTSEFTDRALESEPLCREYLELVASPEVIERLDLPPEPTPELDLRDVPVVAYDEDVPLVRTYWRSVFQTTPDVRPVVVVNSLRAVREFTIGGAGITVLPEHVVADELYSGELRRVWSPSDRANIEMHLVRRAGPQRHELLTTVHETIRLGAKAWQYLTDTYD